MPTSSQRSITLAPRRILVLNSANTVPANRYAETLKTVDINSDNKPKSSVFSNSFKKSVRKTRCRLLLLIVLLVLLILLLMSLVALAIVLPLVLKQKNVATDNTSAVIPTTTLKTTTTTTIVCTFPYVQASPGICVNPLLDLQNCGTIGYICSSNYTSCSAGVCSAAPIVQLINSTSLWTGGIDGPADDNTFNITLPFPITLYNTTTAHIQVTTNGVLCLTGCSNAWQDNSLPNSAFGAVVFPYWDDLYITSKTWQGIYYTSQGITPSRTLVVEYYLSRYVQPNEFYHFQVTFFEAKPGIVQFTYFQVYDTGLGGAVGVQSSGPSLQYSFHQMNSIQANMTLTFDTNLGLYTNSSLG